MFVLHIGLPVADGMGNSLEQTFIDEFRPAISAQEGFRDVQLLRSADDQPDYCLVIAFASQEQQKKWVASDLHQQVWPALAKNCQDFILRTYNSIS